MVIALIVLLVIDSLVLALAVLLQSGKGSGMAASFGGVSSSPDSFIGTRQAGDLLTKITWWSAGIFLGIAFVLQIASTHTALPKSVLDKPFSSAPAPAQQQAAPPATPSPAVPLQPVPSSTSPSSNTGAPNSGARKP